MARALLWAAVVCPLGAAYGQLFKCVGADGKTSYQSEPCPVAAKEQRVNVQPSSGESASFGPLKPGWSEHEVTSSVDVCAKGILSNLRKHYETKLETFPEGQFTPPVERYCSCLARRTAATWTSNEFAEDPRGRVNKLADEAFKGGPCKPNGPLAEFLRKSRVMQ